MGYAFPPAETGACVRGLCRADELEADAPALLRLVPVVADDAEGTDFCRVGHVRADAEAFVVVAYLDYAHRLRGVVWQALQVEAAAGLLLRDEFRGDVQVTADDFVHGILQPLHVFFRRLLLQAVVQLALLPFDVCRNRPSAPEKAYHGLVDNVFAGVHGRVFLLVVLVERGLLFHIEKYFVGFIFHKEPSFSADKE